MKSKLAFLLFTLFAHCFCIHSQTEETLTLTTETGGIYGTLLTPNNQINVPIVLIISGSGPTDRNGNNPFMTNNALKMLAVGLQENGIASLRYDKRGVGESQASGKSEKDLRFEDYIHDAELWIEKLKSDNRFSKMIVLGHSEGSLVGMIASQKTTVDQFISLAGAGDKAGSILKKQLETQPQEIKDIALPIIDSLETGKTVQDVNQLLFALFRPSVQPYMISWFKYNPQQEIAKLDKPILIIQGDTDIQVSTSDANQLEKANPGAKKVIIHEMNHVLKKSSADRQENILTYTNPDLPLHEELIHEIITFIKQ